MVNEWSKCYLKDCVVSCCSMPYKLINVEGGSSNIPLWLLGFFPSSVRRLFGANPCWVLPHKRILDAESSPRSSPQSLKEQGQKASGRVKLLRWSMTPPIDFPKCRCTCKKEMRVRFSNLSEHINIELKTTKKKAHVWNCSRKIHY